MTFIHRTATPLTTMKNETTSITTSDRIVLSHPRLWFSSMGRIASNLTALLLVAYVVTTLLGFASLESPDDPIQDPYFTLMEIFILLMMPLMLLVMVAFHQWAHPSKQIYSLAALGFLAISTGITSSVHFVVWTVGQPISEQVDNGDYFFSFQWPSVAYALDILSWDWFFAWSMLFGAFIVNWRTRIEKAIRILMLTSAVLSFVGLIALPLDNMDVRIIGIVGYAFVTIPVFILLGVLLGHQQSSPESANSVILKDDLTKEDDEQKVHYDSGRGRCEVSSDC